MKHIFVFYKGANQHSLSAGPAHRVVLNPGRNKVNADDWAAIEKTSDKGKGGVNYLKAKGLIKVTESDNEVEELNITDYKLPEAVELIEAEVDLENLLKFMEQEEATDKPRKGVMEAIDARVKLMDEESGAAD